MPIFEYVCGKCKHSFETIVQGNKQATCPKCNSRKLEKQLSIFAAATKEKVFDSGPRPMSACGTCGDPRGPGSCSMN
jgi:putative FmdB family regulatory protein